MNFSMALEFLKKGTHMKRYGWNGKNLNVYVFYPNAQGCLNLQLAENNYINPHFRIWDRDKKTVDSWVPSVADILADDWLVYDKDL